MFGLFKGIIRVLFDNPAVKLGWWCWLRFRLSDNLLFQFCLYLLEVIRIDDLRVAFCTSVFVRS